MLRRASVRRKREDDAPGAIYARGGAAPGGDSTFDVDLNFLSRWDGPLGRPARAMLAYVFIVERVGKIGGYAGVTDHVQAHGVDGRLPPLVILTERAGDLLVLFGFKTRWAAIALFSFCLLTGAFFHTGAEQAIQLQKNIATAGGFLALALLGPGAWSLDGCLAGASRLARAVAEALSLSGRVERLSREHIVCGSGLTPADLIRSSAGIFRWRRPPCRSTSARPIESLSATVPSATFRRS